MKVINNVTFPSIKLYTSDKTPINYFSFDVSNTTITNAQNLQKFNFKKSTDDVIGQFSFTYKESLTESLLEEKTEKPLLDKIKLLDIVQIYENDEIIPSFIGIINNKSVSSTAQTCQKLVTISGYSIEYLFQMFTISDDATAMSAYNAQTQNKNILSKVYAGNKGTDGIAIKEAIKEAFNGESGFKKTAVKFAKISATKIGDLIETWFGEDFISIDEQLKFVLPVATPIFQTGTVNFLSYIRSILPSDVYKVYGIINTFGKPQLKIEINPFSSTEWIKLKNIQVEPYLITDYAFTQSNENVYTVFFSYIEGSFQSPEMAKALSLDNIGYKNAAENDKKIEVYGYRPLFCNFTGFLVDFKNQEEENKANKTIDEKQKILNEKLKEWYGRLEEFYNGSLTCVVVDGYSYPKIGEILKLRNMQFYVDSESHSWSYGYPITINYECSRGAEYKADGSYKEITGLSAMLKELDL